MHSFRGLRLLLIIVSSASSTAFGQTLASITISGPSSIVAGAGPVVYMATGTYTGGAKVNLSTSLKWSSSDPTVVKFNDPTSPVAVPVASGSALIWASDSSSPASGNLIITVTAAPALPALTSFAFSPANLTVVSGQTLTPLILGTYGVGAAATVKPIPANVPVWSTPSPPSVVTIAAGVITGGTVTGSDPITAVVNITIPPLPAKQVTITVTPAPTTTATAASSISIAGGLTQLSSTILVNAPASHNIALFVMPSTATVCSAATVKTAAPISIVTSSATATSTTSANTLTLPSGSPPFTVSLAQSLIKGELLCIEDLGATPSLAWSPTPAIVGDAILTPTTPSFTGNLVAGSSSIMVQGNADDTISVYQLDPSYNADQPCSSTDPNRRELLQVVTNGSTTTTTGAFKLSSPLSTTLTLTRPLVGGTSLCLAETESGFSEHWSSESIAVVDPNDFGRFRTYFVAGIQASNQLSPSSSNSTTAGEYLEGGFNSTWLRARDKWDEHDLVGKTIKHWQSPGISTNIDVRLSPIPVAASQTTTTSTVPTPMSTSIMPNSLSSQQAIRVTGSLYFPWKLTNWNNHTDFFTVAPMVRGGFGTLINPTSSSTMNAGSSPTITSVVSTQFSSAYDFDAFGGRFAWDRYTPNANEGPQTMTQVLITFGTYSNLPSYVCKPTPSGTQSNASSTVTTACNQGQYAPNNTTTPPSNQYNYSRSVIPRVDIEGLAKLPGYPFVLGIDANLQQYTFFSKNNLDYLNKPGNDIRIYVGVSINLSTVFSSKLGFSGP